MDEQYAQSVVEIKKSVCAKSVCERPEKMSVFSDFQRMWEQKFPHKSLSEAWEQDVRASLLRHRQKIDELREELEQETLYVEYLERLLSDVEKQRESGVDPKALIEAATPSPGHTVTDPESSRSDDEVHTILCNHFGGQHLLRERERFLHNAPHGESCSASQ